MLPSPPQVPTDRDAILEAMESAIFAVAALAAGITEEQSVRDTPCPGWTVRDHVAHVTGLESRGLGRPGADSHQLPETLAHVTTDLKRFMELDVDVRRPLPWPTVQAEAAEVLSARVTQLRALPFDADTLIDSPFGPRPAKSALSLRTFDIWAHEQDIRDALGEPGGMDSPAARVAIARAVASLGHIASVAGLADNEAVTIEVPDGPFAFTASSNPAAETRATLRMGSANFTRLCCGRTSADPASVEIVGDSALGRRFLAAMASTP